MYVFFLFALQAVRLYMLMNLHSKKYMPMLIQEKPVSDEVFRLQQSFE